MPVPRRRRRRRLPDEVRAAAVRAVLSLAFTLVGVVVATLASYAGSWMLTPALMAMGLGVFGTMWCLLEILISRQVAAQRTRAPDSAHPMTGSRAPTAPPPGAGPLPPPLPRPGSSVYQQPYEQRYDRPYEQPPYQPQQQQPYQQPYQQPQQQPPRQPWAPAPRP
ncbi:hypothetical protein ACFQ6N_34145 [Kitasatospora sp. NPDC056446]|uniref:hypothetical protein n=1 Tax=Kitasatospora sp. NPDC056446 TaxID=3345819 RepID=UPI0036781DE1